MPPPLKILYPRLHIIFQMIEDVWRDLEEGVETPVRMQFYLSEAGYDRIYVHMLNGCDRFYKNDRR